MKDFIMSLTMEGMPTTMLEEAQEEVGVFAKKAATWLTGKGFSMALVTIGTAAFGMEAPLIPIISLPIAAGIAIINSDTSHGQREKKILNAYRKEIGAFLDIEPNQVSIEHLHMIANGNKKLGIPGNYVIKQAIERNDSTRSSSFFAHLGAMATSVLVVLGIAGAFSGGLATSTLAELLGDSITQSPSLSVMAVAATAALTNFVMDEATSFLAADFLGLRKPTANDRIKQIGKDIADGKTIGKEQIFSLFVEANPKIAAAIENNFGSSYHVLPKGVQKIAVNSYEQEFHISAITELVNAQRIDVTELAFAAQGLASGVQARPEEQEDNAVSPAQTPKAPELSHHKPVGARVAIAHEAGIGIHPNAITLSDTQTVADETPAGFAARFQQKHRNSSYAAMVKRRVELDLKKEQSHDTKTALGEELLSDAADIITSL
jgi:hypothetical protein